MALVPGSGHVDSDCCFLPSCQAAWKSGAVPAGVGVSVMAKLEGHRKCSGETCGCVLQYRCESEVFAMTCAGDREMAAQKKFVVAKVATEASAIRVADCGLPPPEARNPCDSHPSDRSCC